MMKIERLPEFSCLATMCGKAIRGLRGSRRGTARSLRSRPVANRLLFLSDEIGAGGSGFRLRSLFAMGVFHEPGQIFCKGAHDLHSFFVLCCLSGHFSMDSVPILGCGKGHIIDSEILVKSVESSGITTPAAYGNCCSRLVHEQI